MVMTSTDRVPLLGGVAGAGVEQSRTAQQDKFKAIREDLEEVRQIAVANVEKVLERGEKLEEVQARTEELAASSRAFHVSARKVRRGMWWRSVKPVLVVAGVVIVAITIVVLCIAL